MSQATIRLGGKVFDEYEFVERMKKRDPGALALVVGELRTERAMQPKFGVGLYVVSRAFRPLVIGYLLRDWFRDDPESADEAWNEALWRIHTRIEEYDPQRSGLVTWIINQARYAAMDAKRRVRAGAPVHERLVVWDDEVAPLTSEEKRALDRARARLTDLENRLLTLRVVEGRTNNEIARDFFDDAYSDLQVRVYVHRAIKRLATFFDEELEEELRK
jgi:RNA polymerase sigma factor (sigma-70 family)